MHRKLSGRAVLAAVTLTFSCVLSAAWSAAPAQAASGSSDCQSSGGSSGGGGGSDGDYQLWVAVSSQIPSCAGGGNASQTDGTGGGVTVHVPCWWGEEYSPAGLEGYVQGFEATSSTDNWYMILAAEYDKNGTDPFTAGYTSDAGPPWESYNVNSAPAGAWYGLILNNGDTSDQLTACTNEEDARAPEMFYWGDNGIPPADLPANAPGFTAEDLAKYVESVVQLPQARVLTSQGKGTKATVGLPVWYWQNEGTKSTLMGYQVCAFTVCVDFHAEAVSFSIVADVGKSPAMSWSSGCTAHAATNTLGTPYTNQPASTNPSCGVLYTARANQVNPLVLTTWHVDITWPGGQWSPPADPVITTALARSAVQDVQSVNQATSTP